MPFDSAGWHAYVNEHRKADPGISTRGHEQADKLKDYLVEHLENQSSHPVRVITSPMRRTLETILPTLTELNKEDKKVELIVNALYHESEGCHTHDIPGNYTWHYHYNLHSILLHYFSNHNVIVTCLPKRVE